MTEKTYEKFKVSVVRRDNPRPLTIPWTGVDQTLSYVKEMLKEGNIVTIIPYTREEWSEGK